MDLYQHQKEIVEKNPSKWLLAWETGTGKSLTSIRLAESKSDDILVVCPKSLRDKWYDDIKIGSENKNCRWNVLTKEEFRKWSSVIKGNNCLIVDEAHYFGQQKSKMTKALMNYIKQYSPEYIYLLTATPYMSSVWSVYSLGLILGKKWSYPTFRKKFFYDVKMGRRMIPVQKKKIEKDVAKLVHSLGNTIKLSDCVDMPEQIFETEYFELVNEQKKMIETIYDPVPVVRWTKIHQICGGTLKADAYSDNILLPSEKKQRAIELVQANKKIAIVCRYNLEIDMLATEIQKFKPVVKIRGDVKDKQGAVDAVNKLDEVCVLINGAASEGYGLPTVPIMVFYSYDFSLKNYIQVKGRIQRINAVQRCVYISLVVKGTIDEDILKMITIHKQDFQIAIYNK
jgi:superfamily II DNA or RNA helicase